MTDADLNARTDDRHAAETIDIGTGDNPSHEAAQPAPARSEPKNLPDTWDYQKSTNSVVCGGCMFRYGAEHPDGDGKWTCPNCGDGNGQPAAAPLGREISDSIKKQIGKNTDGLPGVYLKTEQWDAILALSPAVPHENLGSLEWEREIRDVNAPAVTQHERREPVAWRWRPRGAINWIYDPTAEWRSQQKGADIDIEPLYATPNAVDREAVIELLDQIKAVCEDNAPESCNKKMALEFLRHVVEGFRAGMGNEK
jgi:hypothetical protein